MDQQTQLLLLRMRSETLTARLSLLQAQQQQIAAITQSVQNNHQTTAAANQAAIEALLNS